MDLTGMPTILDLAKQKGNDVTVGLIEESILVNPEVGLFPSRQISGTSYKTLVRTGYPVAQFRNINEGVPRSKSQFENRTVECYIIDQQIAADKALADVWEPGGFPAYQMIEAQGVTEAVFRLLGRQIYYGNSAQAITLGLGHAKGFPGFIDAVDSAKVIDAGGDPNATGGVTSAWFVKFGLKDVHLILGGNTVLNLLPEWRIQTVQSETNAAFTAYVNSLMGWVGMQVGSVNSLVRVKNISTENGHTMSDVLGGLALEAFPTGVKPDLILMNRRSRRQLKNARVAQAIGQGFTANSVPLPTEIEGIPIQITDAIANGESTL